MKYSFCESVTATSMSPWHIRRLTKVGRKLGGGIDTPSLCGRVRKEKGWDLETPINAFHLANGCCPECLKLFEEQKESLSSERKKST